jgi:hypothetical protein
LTITEAGSVIRKKNDIKFTKTVEVPNVQIIPGEDSELSKAYIKDSIFFIN